MMKFKRSALVLAMFGGFLLSGCGGSSSSTGDGPTVTEESSQTTTEQTTKTGTFLDSAVEGLRYVTPTKTGLTGANGEFEYQEGEVVFFLLGNSLVGSSMASDVMTPLDMINENSNTSKMANVLRFLQSLDQDDNPDNGITISQTVQNQAELDGIEVDFDVDADAFGSQTAVDNVLSADNKVLISEEAANNHFQATVDQLDANEVDLKGTWFTQTTFVRDGQKCGEVAETTVVFDGDGYTETGDELNSSSDGTIVSCNTVAYSGMEVAYASAPDDLPAKGCDQGICSFNEVNKYFPNWEAGSWELDSQQFSVVVVKYYPGMDKMVRTKTDKVRTRDINGNIVSVDTWGTFTTVYFRKEAAEYTKNMVGTWDVTSSNLSCPDVTAIQTLVYSETGIQVSGQELNLVDGNCEFESTSGTFAYDDPQLSADFCGPVCDFKQLNGTFIDEGEEIQLSHVRGTDVINRTKGYSHRQRWVKVD
ncbi:hypothetical protein [Marinobacter orientalis]|uniref:Lipoprotein n=1 Tax=Marinobacter orientalis TaxID=1928859 RepID=A0A7Y0NIU4_9GAMM|nr:hypothetical protein [Marinobacter orientalis]NMT62230.1 hypothetical protein [Marinobacter orientalis]TGX50946.1 hypothetical protein DIT72_02600 [Marinobacter orientalis]